MNNHKKYQALGAVMLAAVLAIFNPGTADSQINAGRLADLSAKEVISIVIEDFEDTRIADSFDDDGWYVETTPRAFTSEQTEEKLRMRNPVHTLSLKIIEGSPSDLKTEELSPTGLGTTSQYSLGLNFRFRYPGNNSVHILPPKEVDWKERTPVVFEDPRTGERRQDRALQLPGRSRGISVWVHGRGNPYNLEAWIEDFRGNTHIIQMGSINFIGWRPMVAYIPEYIPQESTSYPRSKTTKLKKFVLRANTAAPHEALTDNTFIFFDQVKSLSDTYEVNFHGSDLHKQFE